MIRAGAYLTLAWAVLMGPSLCCCSTQAFFQPLVDQVTPAELSCPHCAAKAPSEEPASPCTQDPSSTDCPVCELARMTPAWGSVPSVVAIDLDHSLLVPAFDLVLSDVDSSVAFARSDGFVRCGPFTHLSGVGILRACSRLNC